MSEIFFVSKRAYPVLGSRAPKMPPLRRPRPATRSGASKPEHRTYRFHARQDSDTWTSHERVFPGWPGARHESIWRRAGRSNLRRRCRRRAMKSRPPGSMSHLVPNPRAVHGDWCAGESEGVSGPLLWDESAVLSRYDGRHRGQSHRPSHAAGQPVRGFVVVSDRVYSSSGRRERAAVAQLRFHQ